MHYEHIKNRTLVMRLWERLVERLCALHPRRDETDPHLYHLFSADGAHAVSVRAELKHWQEGVYTEVRIMDQDGTLILQESVHSLLLPGPEHPALELIAFLSKPYTIVTLEVAALQRLLA